MHNEQSVARTNVQLLQQNTKRMCYLIIGAKRNGRPNKLELVEITKER